MDILFVHGTGVRKAEFDETMSKLRENAAPRGWTLQGCLWGDELGANLGEAKSVPLYDQSKAIEDTAVGAGPADGDPDSNEAWARLLQDPLIELRLASRLPQPPRQGLTKPQLPVTLNPILAALTDEPVLCKETPDAYTVNSQIQQLFKDAAGEVLKASWLESSFWAASHAALGGQAGEKFAKTLVARAIVAAWMNKLLVHALPMPTGKARDAAVQLVAEALGVPPDQEKGIASTAWAAVTWPVRQIAGIGGTLVLRAGTWGTRVYRRSIADAASLKVGDILLYQARGQKIRERIAQAVAACATPPIVLAHSLGGIATVDLLMTDPQVRVAALVTVGSQSAFLHELGALVSLEPKAAAAEHLPRWINVYDKNDLLSFVAEPIFGQDRVRDLELDNGQPFPVSHSAYWANGAFWKALDSLVSELGAR